MGITRVEQTDASFTYTGAGWTLATLAGPSGGSFKYTNGSGDYCEIAYSGFGCALIIACSTSGGEFDVYLDDVFQFRVTSLTAAWSGEGVTYTSNIIWQLPIYVPCATDDDHIVKIARINGTMYIDAIDIVDARDAPTAGKLVGIGDSWTAGSAASETAKRYLNLFQTAIGAGSLDNNGISGNELAAYKSNYGYWRAITDIIAETPETLVIAIGYNDCRRGTLVSVFERFYVALLRLIEARLDTTTMVVLCATPGHSTTVGLTEYPPYDQATPQRFLQFGEAVRRSADEMGFVPVEWYFAMNQTDALMDADDVHPNDAGHAVLAQELYRSYLAGSYYDLFPSSDGGSKAMAAGLA